MSRPRLNGFIKVISSDKVKRPETQIYTGHKLILSGGKQDFVKLIAY